MPLPPPPPNTHALHPLVQSLKRGVRRILLTLVLLSLLVFMGYCFMSYFFAYSRGETVGYVQKLSNKGWLCKTWEGEQMRFVNVLTTPMEKFFFTVRDDDIVQKINASLGKKMVMKYEQHVGLPSCFGDTEYFVTDIHPAPN